MSEKKKQHQIPKSFMKHFSTNGKLSCIIGDFDNLQVISNIPYKDQCYENFYYGKDLKWENRLGEIESTASIVINKIIDGTHSITKEEHYQIIKFIAYQIARVPSFVQKNIFQRAQALYTVINMQNAHTHEMDGISFDFVYNYVASEQDETIDSVLSLAEKTFMELKDLKYSIAKFETRRNLLFSDNPVIVQNDFLIAVNLKFHDMYLMRKFDRKKICERMSFLRISYKDSRLLNEYEEFIYSIMVKKSKLIKLLR